MEGKFDAANKIHKYVNDNHVTHVVTSGSLFQAMFGVCASACAGEGT